MTLQQWPDSMTDAQVNTAIIKEVQAAHINLYKTTMIFNEKTPFKVAYVIGDEQAFNTAYPTKKQAYFMTKKTTH